jgi:hypothetical protein
VQHGVGVLDGAGRQPSIRHLPVHPLHVHTARIKNVDPDVIMVPGTLTACSGIASTTPWFNNYGCRCRTQLPKLQLAQGWFQVAPYLLSIGFVRTCPNAALHAFSKPPIEILAHAQVFYVEDEPAVPVGEGLVELL